MENNNDKKIKIYITLLITVVCIIGVSYAYFRLVLSQKDNNSLASRTCFSTTLTEQTSKIALTDVYPVTDEEGIKGTPYTFTIKNNCTGYVKATITIDSEYRTKTSTTYLNDAYVKANISKSGSLTQGGQLLGKQELVDLDNSRKGYKLLEIKMGPNQELNYDLRIWLDADTNIEQGLNKKWEGKIVVATVAIKEPAAPNGWNEAADGTLLAAIKKDNQLGEPQTTPGAEVSASYETVLASTEDDYGTSYYFRGAVTNNFVEYANMCWRIVRVTGDGSIKLVLYNYNGLEGSHTPSSSTPCNVTGDNYAVARYYYDDVYRSYFNSNLDDNAYIGFMYGEVGASSYAATHANTNPSEILTNLNAWYTDVLSKQSNFSDSQLADTIWCNDKRVVTDTTYNPNNVTLGTNYGYGTNINYYSAIKRLKSSSGSAGGTGPSLICPNDNDGGKLSKFTVSDTEYGNGALKDYAKIGLLTADEIAFAGGAAKANLINYLMENVSNVGWWTLSPGKFTSSTANNFAVATLHNRFVIGDVRVNNIGCVRPSLSLTSSIQISSGDGTATNPYKIAA